FNQKYASWYVEGTEHVIPKSRKDARICLTAALFRDHLLPVDTTEVGLGNRVMEVLRANWHRQGLQFPKECQIVLCHEVNFPRRTFSTTHAAILWQRESGYTYLEKAGGAGPFVRLDIKAIPDLFPWLSAQFKGLEYEYTHLFVSFNDVRI